MFIKYEHHGNLVWVNSDNVGKHRDVCLCYCCMKFWPNEEKNCPIAEKVYSLCKEESLTLPVWECPEFEHYVVSPGPPLVFDIKSS